MMLHRIGLMMLLTLASSSLFSAELQRITLQDGSIVNAEVLSLKNGVYTLKSPAMGEVAVHADRIRAINSLRNTQPQAPGPGPAPAMEMEQIQSSLLSSADTVKVIMSLQNDPQVRAILSDRDIMAAIQRGDYESLASNPKIKRLMNKAEIKQITGSVAR